MENKLLILDMDETLMHTVHYYEGPEGENKEIKDPYDAKIPIIYSEKKTKYLFVNFRPYIKEILTKLKSLYRIVVFTASLQNYADAILNHLDPNYEIFENRYYRNHCYNTKDRITVKDLRLFEQFNSKNDKNWNL